jgi:hypothetical protein
MHICSSEHMYKCTCWTIRYFLKFVLKPNTYEHLSPCYVLIRTFVPEFLPLKEAPQEVLFLYVCETCCQHVLTFFFTQKLTLSPILNLQNSRMSHEWDMDNIVAGWWLEFGQKYHTIACVMKMLILSHHTDFNQPQFLSFLVAKEREHSWFGISFTKEVSLWGEREIDREKERERERECFNI